MRGVYHQAAPPGAPTGIAGSDLGRRQRRAPRGLRPRSFWTFATHPSPRAQLPTIVALEAADPLVGLVLRDDLVPLYRDELSNLLGSLSPATLRRVGDALRVALP